MGTSIYKQADSIREFLVQLVHDSAARLVDYFLLVIGLHKHNYELWLPKIF